MQQLEAFLGGELPKCGVSWREERRLLLDKSKVRQGVWSKVREGVWSNVEGRG